MEKDLTSYGLYNPSEIIASVGMHGFGVIGSDLPQIETIFGVMVCPIPWERAFCCLLFCVIGLLSFQDNVLVENGLGFSPTSRQGFDSNIENIIRRSKVRRHAQNKKS